MDAIALTDIPFVMDMPALFQKLHVDPHGPDAVAVEALARAAQAVARPKALYKLAFVDDRRDDTVAIDGVRFVSRVLSVNLAQVHRVFAYVATCGAEMDAWEQSISDPFDRYWADAIKEMALRQAVELLHREIQRHAGPGTLGTMNPGSLPDWPMPQQRPLFDLLGDVTGQIGVQLTDSFLMVPNKSVSGIRFPTQVQYENCQLCPRELCPGRQAPYDPSLFERRFARKG